jgi:hypothetical protein
VNDERCRIELGSITTGKLEAGSISDPEGALMRLTEETVMLLSAHNRDAKRRFMLVPHCHMGQKVDRNDYGATLMPPYCEKHCSSWEQHYSGNWYCPKCEAELHPPMFPPSVIIAEMERYADTDLPELTAMLRPGHVDLINHMREWFKSRS